MIAEKPKVSRNVVKAKDNLRVVTLWQLQCHSVWKMAEGSNKGMCHVTGDRTKGEGRETMGVEIEVG